MTVNYTTLLGLAKPVSGTESGTWGDTVNTNLTDYLDSAVAGAQIISGTQTAVTLSKTTGASLSQAGLSNITGSSQYQIIRCTGNPTSLLTITVPAADKTYIVINATSTSQSVKIVGTGPTSGVTITAGSQAIVAWNGSDFVNLTPAATGFLPTTGGTMTGAITFASGQTLSATSLKSATTDIAISSATAPTTGQVLTATDSTTATWQSPASSIPSVVRSAKTSAYTLVAGDKGTLIEVTSGTFTLSLTAAATLGSGWWCYVSNIGTGLITIDPNSSETITVNGEALSTWVQWTNEIGLLQCNGTGFSYYQFQKGTITQTVSSAVASIVFSGCLAYRRSMLLSWDSGALSADNQVKFLLNTSTTPTYSGGYVDQGSSISALTALGDNFTLGNEHGSANTGSSNGMNGQAIITLSDTAVEANITSKYITPASRVDRGQTLSLFSSVTRTSITNITIKPNSANFTGGTFTLTEL